MKSSQATAFLIIFVSFCHIFIIFYVYFSKNYHNEPIYTTLALKSICFASMSRGNSRLGWEILRMSIKIQEISQYLRQNAVFRKDS